MTHLLRDSLEFIYKTDPAARSKWGIILHYPGFHILCFYKIGRFLWRYKFYELARFVMALGRFFTGIEIHPAAAITGPLFIDHGMGVVIGETAIIGGHVLIYHGVTLGGTSLEKGVKRHPTLHDHVIIGAGAHILGDITLHEHAKIGANAVVIKDVKSYDSVVGIPARSVGCTKEADFMAYGMPHDCPDIVEQLHQSKK